MLYIIYIAHINSSIFGYFLLKNPLAYANESWSINISTYSFRAIIKEDTLPCHIRENLFIQQNSIKTWIKTWI